ncbi:hypothetical protein C8R42DRAFT_648603 [Lentinula raphanica]|nr:hypothetical protein C8R42DRAFT_648603 [Lentinula raphanica]
MHNLISVVFCRKLALIATTSATSLVSSLTSSRSRPADDELNETDACTQTFHWVHAFCSTMAYGRLEKRETSIHGGNPDRQALIDINISPQSSVPSSLSRSTPSQLWATRIDSTSTETNGGWTARNGDRKGALAQLILSYIILWIVLPLPSRFQSSDPKPSLPKDREKEEEQERIWYSISRAQIKGKAQAIFDNRMPSYRRAQRYSALTSKPMERFKASSGKDNRTSPLGTKRKRGAAAPVADVDPEEAERRRKRAERFGLKV